MRAIKDLGALLLRRNVLVEKLGASIEIADQGCDPRRFHSWDGACTLRVMLMSHSGSECSDLGRLRALGLVIRKSRARTATVRRAKLTESLPAVRSRMDRRPSEGPARRRPSTAARKHSPSQPSAKFTALASDADPGKVGSSELLELTFGPLGTRSKDLASRYGCLLRPS